VLHDSNLLAGDGKGLGVVELLNALDSRFGSLEVDETMSLGLAAFTGNHGRSDLAADGKCSLELLVSHVLPEVLHIHVGEGLASVPLLVGNVVGDDQGKELGRSQLLAVGGFHGAFSLLAGLVLNEAKALGLAVVAASNLARQDVAKLGESVQEITGRHRGIGVLDEDVSSARLAHGGIALLPHDAKGPSLDHVVVERIESALGVLSAGEVDVGVAKGHTGNVVTKHTDGVDGADDGEDLEQLFFTNILVEIADVQRGGGRGRSTRDGSTRDGSNNGSSHFFLINTRERGERNFFLRCSN